MSDTEKKYFVRRNDRVKGPLAVQKLRDLWDADRLRLRDEIAESADGPWSPLAHVYDELFGDGGDADDGSAFDDDLMAPPTKPRPRRTAAGGAAAPLQTADMSLVKRLKPWQWAAAGGAAGMVALLAIVAGVVLSPTVSVQHDGEDEPAASIRPEPPRPAPKPARPRRPAAVAPAAGTASAPADAPPAAASAPEVPLAAEPAMVDHEASIKATLAAYYAAGDWEERYRTVVPDDAAKQAMRGLYQDVDWVSVEWSVVKMPAADELAAAAGEGRRVRVDTLTNGNPHVIFLVFTQGRWRVDWLQSLNTLWLSK